MIGHLEPLEHEMEDLLSTRCLVDSTDASHTMPSTICLKDNRITLEQRKVNVWHAAARTSRRYHIILRYRNCQCSKKTWAHLDQLQMAMAGELITSEADVFT